MLKKKTMCSANPRNQTEWKERIPQQNNNNKKK